MFDQKKFDQENKWLNSHVGDDHDSSTITLIECDWQLAILMQENLVSDFPGSYVEKPEIETQQLWRTVSQGSHSGFFVWEILEAQLGKVEKPAHYLTECRDGSYVLIQCYHYWTEDRALAGLNDDTFAKYQKLIIIETKELDEPDIMSTIDVDFAESFERDL